MTSIADPSQFIDVKVREPVYLDDPIRLAGGWQIGLDPDEDMGSPITLLAGSATFRGAGDPARAEGTVGIVPKTERPGLLFDVPDIKATSARFTVEWRDDCFTYLAEKVWGLQMVRAAQAARCPTDADGFVAHWATMGEPPILVGDVGTDLSPDEMVGLWTAGAVGSQGNDPLISWDPAGASVIGAAGSVVAVRPANEDLGPISMTAEFRRRNAVEAWQAGLADRPRPIFNATADPYPDSHLDLLVPPDAGRYVVSLRLVAETPCLHVGAVGAVSIDVE